ncbi:LacI family transcriptional regulator [Plasticicumulans lactativorans]|uniref:LacI family transcriptional regulator n=1 Tax=Plasticicumulans lactativorans TaxID=1133106 RepID=A0A4R2L4K3_9GAMM|nr:LacI family DNA-binding transcriptional regulator [Plasticicumulans lactativorans]TCO81534.1 LacI family transcriptional regulator [Plasticicumulans lactativorans]
MSDPRHPRASGRATLSDVARHARVSAITVSRALNTPDKVSSELRERIEIAVRELGYVPDRSARALASRQSFTVAVLVPSLSNAVFVDTLRGISERLDPFGYQLLIGDTGYSAEVEERRLRAYLEHRPDGVLLTGQAQTEGARALLAHAGVPVVRMMDLSADGLCVGFSQIKAGYALTRHLLERGHRRIAYVAAQLDERVRLRGEGYRCAVREVGGDDPRLEVAVPDPSSVHLGGELLGRLLQQAPDCDAVFCCNDDLAWGAIFECQRRGIDVPGRLAIAGFNDLEMSACINPALTTIATPRHQIGVAAADLLLAAIAGEPPADGQRDLGFSLVVRQST